MDLHPTPHTPGRGGWGPGVWGGGVQVHISRKGWLVFNPLNPLNPNYPLRNYPLLPLPEVTLQSFFSTSMSLCVIYGGPLLSFLGFPNKQKKKKCTIPNLMGEQKPLKINPRRLKMEKLVSSKNVNLIAKIQYKVHFSSKTKWREDHVKIIFKLSGWF